MKREEKEERVGEPPGGAGRTERPGGERRKTMFDKVEKICVILESMLLVWRVVG